MTEPLALRGLQIATSRTRGATERLAILFDLHHERLFRLALRMVSDRDEALDLAQDAFLRAAHGAVTDDTDRHLRLMAPRSHSVSRSSK